MTGRYRIQQKINRSWKLQTNTCVPVQTIKMCCKPNVRSKLRFLTLVLSVLWSLGCNSSSGLAAGDELDGAFITGPDYRKTGKISYDRYEGVITSSTGCEVVYTYFEPGVGAREVLVVLGHGFMRSRKRMEPLAQHLASWGLPVVNVEFCNSKLWAGNHDRNGADMVALAGKFKVGKVIYAGFSAGGLAAMVAADLDNNTLAYLGLDMVDHRGLGKKIAPDLAIPFFGLYAAPSACNAQNNGLDSYGLAPDSKLIKVEDASHCHFELPVDGKCAFVCGKGEKRFSRVTIQQTIVGLATAFLVWQSGIDVNGENWWKDSRLNYQNLIKAGYIEKFKK